MNIMLILILIIVSMILWLFATATRVNGKDTQVSFIIRSITYWIALIFTYIVAFYIGSH